MPIQKNVSLKLMNSFGINVNAAEFVAFTSVTGLQHALDRAEQEPWILGGGSNILLVDDLRKCVLQNAIVGIEVTAEDADSVHVRVGAGVVWHDLVTWAVKNNFSGVENLALIPGRVGAAPIQNIGAYGVEIKETFVLLEATRLNDGHREAFDADSCAFGYRDSVFKNALKGLYCITHVVLQLRKGPHKLNTTYGAIRETLDAFGVVSPGILDVYDAVIHIRSSKLPDPAEIGNAGSFFKNPVIDAAQFAQMMEDNPNMPFYPVGDDVYKVPAGWLIEQCGWKGKRVGNVSCYEKQALVIVNHGGASGREVYDHAMRVQESVREHFGITLMPEVNVIGGEM